MDTVWCNRVRVTALSRGHAVVLCIPSYVRPEDTIAGVGCHDNSTTVRSMSELIVGVRTADIHDVWEAFRRVDEVIIPALRGAVIVDRAISLHGGQVGECGSSVYVI